jgi:O-antigen ligase
MGLLLWGVAGLCLLLVTLIGTQQGLASFTLALMVAALAGVLIVVRPEWGVIVLTSTFFFSYPEVLQGSGRLTINNVLGLVLGGLLVMRVCIERRAEFLRNRPMQLFLLLAAVLLLNYALVDKIPPVPGLEDQDASARRVQELLTRTAYLVFFVAFVRKRWQLLALAWLVVGAVLLTAPGAAWNALTAVGDNIEQTRAAASFGIATAKNPNRLAFLCAMAIAIIGHVLPEVQSRFVRLAGPVAIVLLVVTILLTASRSGLICLAVLLAMLVAGMGLRHRRAHLLLLALAISIGVALALVPEQHLERITNFVGTERGEEGAGSTLARLELIRMGLRMFADHPILGIGVANFRTVSVSEYGSSRASAQHNAYLLTLVEGGLLLFATYLLIFRSLWRELRDAQRLASQRTGPGLAWLVRATRAMLVLFLVISAFADVWHELSFYIIAGLTVAVTNLYRRAARQALASVVAGAVAEPTGGRGA